MNPSELAAFAAELEAAVANVETTTKGSTMTWSVGGRAFAALTDGALEYRLDPVVGAAARRTPDTSASSRGTEWVRFEPATLDQYAEDRGRAWFLSAHRRAVG